MTATELLLTALLALYRPPAATRARIEAHRAQITADATSASERYAVPVGLLLVVGFSESHLGQDRASGGSWGSPIGRNRRAVAGTADHAARDLAASYRACGSWARALRRYRTGLCDRDARRGYTAAFAARLAERLYVRAGLDVPAQLRAAPSARINLTARRSP